MVRVWYISMQQPGSGCGTLWAHSHYSGSLLLLTYTPLLITPRIRTTPYIYTTPYSHHVCLCLSVYPALQESYTVLYSV